MAYLFHFGYKIYPKKHLSNSHAKVNNKDLFESSWLWYIIGETVLWSRLIVNPVAWPTWKSGLFVDMEFIVPLIQRISTHSSICNERHQLSLEFFEVSVLNFENQFTFP